MNRLLFVCFAALALGFIPPPASAAECTASVDIQNVDDSDDGGTKKISFRNLGGHLPY